MGGRKGKEKEEGKGDALSGPQHASALDWRLGSVGLRVYCYPGKSNFLLWHRSWDQALTLGSDIIRYSSLPCICQSILRKYPLLQVSLDEGSPYTRSASTVTIA